MKTQILMKTQTLMKTQPHPQTHPKPEEIYALRRTHRRGIETSPPSGSPPDRSRLRRRVLTAVIALAVLGHDALAAQDVSTSPGVTADAELVPTIPIEPSELPTGPMDPRFFGRYCSDRDIELCEEIAIVVFGQTVGHRTVCADISDLKVTVEHHEAAGIIRRGVLKGSGTMTASGHRLGLCFAGYVSGVGRAAVTGFVPGVGGRAATALLSSNGNALTVASSGKTLRLDKTACGNAPPTVELVAPIDGAVFDAACPVRLVGSYVDDHDSTIPAGRARFHSHVDGVLDGEVVERPGSLSLTVRGLSPGHHAITFLTTDSGGLEDGRTISIQVRDDGLLPCESEPFDETLDALQEDSP